MVSGYVSVLIWFLAFWLPVTNPPSPFPLKGKVATRVGDHFGTFVAVRVDEIVLAKQRSTVARDPANA
jgi:hypothetical protein